MAAQGFVILTLAFRKKGRFWEGECLELGTATFARNLQQAKKELSELVELHLSELEETGECERFFKEHDIRLYTGEIPPKVEIPFDENTFVLPHRVSIGKAA